MNLSKTFSIIGGDLRQLYLAEKLKKDGNNVSVYGLEKLNSELFELKKHSELKTSIYNSKYIILPVPVTRDGISINAPFSLESIDINEKLISMIENKVILGGIVSPLLEYVNKPHFILKDYYSREDFKIKNSIATAEAAIKIALNESVSTIFGSKCLVIGYGRIGKVLSKILKNMGAEVIISARNTKDLTWANVNGFNTINISNFSSKIEVNLVFNTVPAEILNLNTLNLLQKTNLIIDLASNPGGVDKVAAKNLNIKVISALGLPGKHFPKTSSEIIASSIYKIIKEENL